METDTQAIQVQEKQLEGKLATLRSRADSIVVRDQDSYREICEVKNDANSYIKSVGFELDPGIAKAKDTLDHLKNQKAKFVDPAKEIVAMAESKRVAYATEEKRKADEEREREQEKLRAEAQRKADEERRKAEAEAESERKRRQKGIEAQRAAGELKAAEMKKLQKQAEEDAARQKDLAAKQAEGAAKAVPVIKVEPLIPKVTGSKNQTYWKFRVVDEMKIPASYLMPNEAAIGRMVRDTKDKATAEKACPGIEVWSEG